jgi:hypothetical protein
MHPIWCKALNQTSVLAPAQYLNVKIQMPLKHRGLRCHLQVERRNFALEGLLNEGTASSKFK